MTWHCYTHDIDVPARTECPECRGDEAADHRRKTLESYEEARRDAEWQHDQMQRSVSESAYKRANPGDYECPHCRYQSLKSQASRCPLCHGEVGDEYWSVVREGERKDAERNLAASQAEAERKRAAAAAAEAEFIRTAPERAAAAERAAVVAASTAAAAENLRRSAAIRANGMLCAGIGAVLGLFVLGLLGVIGGAAIGMVVGRMIDPAKAPQSGYTGCRRCGKTVTVGDATCRHCSVALTWAK